MLPILLAALASAPLTTPAAAFNGWGLQRLVAGKAANRRQEIISSQISLLNYHFFAEIFVRKHPCLSNASLHCPAGRSVPFPSAGGEDREIHGGRYSSQAMLDAAFPDGEYEFRFNTTSGTPSSQVVKLEKLLPADFIPSAISLTLSQAGTAVHPREVSPAVDLWVSWGRFKNGGEDPNGICPDLIFFAMGDCFGKEILSSGEPFSNSTELLTYRNTTFRVPASLLLAGRTYQLSVEQSKKVTSRDPQTGLPALPCFETTTYLDFNTTSTDEQQVDAETKTCPYPPYQMDPGQTDRRPKPPANAGAVL